MSLKLHFLHSNLDFFPENVQAISDEHGKGFLRIFPKLKRGTMENGSPNILADCYWSLIREISTGECKRQNKTKRVFNEFFSFRI
jgi:hypothetical protein